MCCENDNCKSDTPTHHSHDDHHGHDHQHEHSHEHHDHGHDHSHEHGNGKLPIILLIASAIGYITALLLDSAAVTQSVIIPLYLIVIALSGYSTFWRGLRNLMRLRFNIDTLMTVALVGAVGIGEWKEASLVAILFGLNELLEGFGLDKARSAMAKLLELAPVHATKLVDGSPLVVPVEQLQVDDLVLVKPGEQIPSDGIVISGTSSVNEASITGESLPVNKSAGDVVLGGTINNEGAIQIRITKRYAQSAFATIMKLVMSAQQQRTPTELFINRFARYYTPIIMIIAVAVLVIPPLLTGSSWESALYESLAVLIVGCPCALILSSPIAILAGITRNARIGVLVKGGAHLETLGKLDTIAFDKTGTLTKGEPKVKQVISYEAPLSYEVAGAIEQGSAHPIAKAIMAYVQERQATLPVATNVEAIVGSGMRAVIDGRSYWLGNESVLTHSTADPKVAQDIASLKAQALTIVIVADERRVLGLFGIADEIREESPTIMKQLHQIGIRRTVMLTGDHPTVADQVARNVGVQEVFGGLRPEDKVAHVQALAASGIVGMIGDGVNDTPALASAQLGIAMGKGSASAIETADVVLLQDHLGKLPAAIRIAKRVNRIIRFNITIAISLKLMALLLTIPGWLTLWFAILSDMGATIFVTLVSLTLLLSASERRASH